MRQTSTQHCPVQALFLCNNVCGTHIFSIPYVPTQPNFLVWFSSSHSDPLQLIFPLSGCHTPLCSCSDSQGPITLHPFEARPHSTPTPTPSGCRVLWCTCHLPSTPGTPPALTPFPGTESSLAVPVFSQARISRCAHRCPDSSETQGASGQRHPPHGQTLGKLPGHPKLSISLHRKTDPNHTEPAPIQSSWARNLPPCAQDHTLARLLLPSVPLDSSSRSLSPVLSHPHVCVLQPQAQAVGSVCLLPLNFLCVTGQEGIGAGAQAECAGDLECGDNGTESKAPPTFLLSPT